MRIVLQRVKRAAVRVGDEVVSAIDRGLVVFVGVTHQDDASDVEYLANKIAQSRIFEDAAGKFNLSALDTQASVLVVPQFTLYASTRRGRRPDFAAAAPPEQAEPLVNALIDHIAAQGLRVERGVFRTKMLVEIHNDGPVTIWIDSKER